MNKNQKIVLYGGVAVFAALVAMVGILIYSNARSNNVANDAMARVDSLALANDRLLLTNEFNQLNADFSQYEDQQVYLKNDSLVQQYNAARMKVEGLLRELSARRHRIRRIVRESRNLKGKSRRLRR